jgi:methyl-accepting chemotaxis protein
MQGSSDVAKDAAAAAGELAEMADELRQIVGRFRLAA